VEFVKENFLLIGVAVASGLMLLWPLISRKGGQQLDSAEAVMKINREDAVVIDVREDAEVAKGRIPNAKHIPLGQLSSRLTELQKHKGKPIIVACRSGHRSAGACGILTKNGFENVYNLSGGMIAWEQANLPVEK
jgi:rhodanese-related sulfurtransferase